MSTKLRCVLACAFLACAVLTTLSANPTFIPDAVFKGSALTGWHVLGQAKWQAQNGELVGAANGAGGWLVLDKSYQDVALHFLFKCAAGCKAGVLLRAEKTAEGMKGVFVAIDNGQPSLFAVTLDAQGKELSRAPLRFASGWVRIMAPADPNAAGRGGAGGAGRGAAGAQAGGRGAVPAGGARGGAPGGGRGPAVALPYSAPDTSFKPGEWNEFEVILDAGIIRSYLNMGRETAGVAEDECGAYGPVALFVGGEGEVRFKDVGYADIAMRNTPIETTSSHFRTQRIGDMYYSWGSGAADFNRDGNLDIIAGPYIYYGPNFTKSREIFTATSLKPSTEFAYAHCDFTFDFNGDGWPDILVSPPSASIYINPKGESRRWQKYTIAQSVQSEETTMKDIDGDGRPELVVSANSTVGYYKSDPADVTKPWTYHAVSERGYGVAHGIGAGDVNGDGRPDILDTYGWWENPGPGSAQETWPYHPEAFGWYSRGNFGGVNMFVWDVNGDGLNDVVTVMSAHGFGSAWFEQKKDKATGKISFVQHTIMDKDGYGSKSAGGVVFSQAHGTAMGDVDGDGIPDFIVGKRYWTHLDSYLDPDPYGPPVLYVYRTVRNPKAPGGAEFVPELIHNRGGAGSEVLAVDLNKDGALDIVTSTDRGTFIFWGNRKAAAAKPVAAAAAPAKK